MAPNPEVSMSTSLLYHAFGIRGYHYRRTDYHDGQTIFTGCRVFGCKAVMLMLQQGVGWESCSGSERSGRAPVLECVALGSTS